MKKQRPAMLYIDQFGQHWHARTVKELREQIGNGKSRVSKMYRDSKDGTSYHVGYTIGTYWLDAFTPMRKPV